ncbi:MAG: mannonate dehydratase [Acidobacteria bacterium]|nr:mannonate dehydratase [Acidobacteriota bacterium]
MNRRKFVTLTGMGVTAGALAESLVASQISAAERSDSSSPNVAQRNALMKVGHQHYSSNEILTLLAALGVNNICSALPSRKFDENWTVEGLTKLRERVESFGVKLDMVPLPLSSAYITRAENPNIMLGKSPERDREIDDICQMIRNAARAGIPALKYNMSVLGVVRTESTKGRGGASYSTFVYDKAKQEPPLTEAGPVNEDIYWERITYFVKRVIPVAEEYKVRLACHPHDPGMPLDKGYRGVHTVLGNVAGLKRFVDIVQSQYHGLNFCQGTVSEMLQNPGREIFDVIRYFGQRGKIFNVHFRNISGRFLDFRETFIDDGDVDMLKAMRVYKEIGYDKMMMPDHVPRIAGDTQGLQAFAFTFGYIKALIAAVAAES